MKNKIFEYIHNEYGISPDYLWEKLPSAAAFRHRCTKKWFGVWMSVKRSVIGLSGEGMVDILDVKCEPLLISGLIDGKGILPAYHMNKQHWLTIVLDSSASFEKICSLVDISFDITKPKLRKK